MNSSVAVARARELPLSIPRRWRSVITIGLPRTKCSKAWPPGANRRPVGSLVSNSTSWSMTGVTLLNFVLTPGNVDDRKPVPKLVKHLFGKIIADKGCPSQPLFQ